MIVNDTKNNDALLMALVASIKNNMNEWQIVNINIMKDSTLPQDEIIQNLLENYKSHEGIIYPVSASKIVMLVRLGIVENYTRMKTEVEQKLPGHSCRVLLRKMSAAGMKQIQIDLSQKGDSITFADDLYSQRETRSGNVFLVVDDDAFIRKSMKTLLSSCGDIVEVEAGKQVVPAYLKHNPDMIFLDIHMPDKTGLELIPDIMEVDSDAFIVILSADSNAENVMSALEEGAIGFLTKPPSKAKVQEYLGQCITIK